MEHDEEAIYRALLKEIRMLMADREITQEDIASRLGIRRETMSGYLSGATKKGMPLTTLIGVSGILGIDLEELAKRARQRVARADRED
jgi:transcriptional regulator with XRE-family HTH domain